jgi:hypothetical protein
MPNQAIDRPTLSLVKYEALSATTFVVNPLTGTAVELADGTDALADMHDQLKEARSIIDEARNLIGDELVTRMDRRGRWSLPLKGSGLAVSAPSPKPPVEHNGKDLFLALRKLAGLGLIERDAVDDAVEAETTYTVKKRGVNALYKLGGAVAEAIDRCQVEAEVKPRRVSVKRTGAR